MPVINSVKYPDTPAEMAKYSDKTLVKQFYEFCPSQATANDNIFANTAAKATMKNSHDVFEKSGLHIG